MPEIKLAIAADADQLAELARPIWTEHYEPIIGIEQVNYMLEKFQSAPAIRAQMAEGYQYFKLLVKGKSAGYFSIQKRQDSLFISKFYLCAEFRGQGLAKPMLAKIKEEARNLGCIRLELTVNKFNPAYEIYLKLGFENVESLQIDIGNGYIMDDFRMVKTLTD